MKPINIAVPYCYNEPDGSYQLASALRPDRVAPFVIPLSGKAVVDQVTPQMAAKFIDSEEGHSELAAAKATMSGSELHNAAKHAVAKKIEAHRTSFYPCESHSRTTLSLFCHLSSMCSAEVFDRLVRV